MSKMSLSFGFYDLEKFLLSMLFQMKNKTTAALLGIFLGSFGAHKFYLEKSSIGLVYLIFCWTLIPGIIGLIEGLSYLSRSQENRDNRYNEGKDSLTGKDKYDEMLKLYDLKEKGIITENEYQEKIDSIKHKETERIKDKENKQQEKNTVINILIMTTSVVIGIIGVIILFLIFQSYYS